MMTTPSSLVSDTLERNSPGPSPLLNIPSPAKSPTGDDLMQPEEPDPNAPVEIDVGALLLSRKLAELRPRIKTMQIQR